MVSYRLLTEPSLKTGEVMVMGMPDDGTDTGEIEPCIAR